MKKNIVILAILIVIIIAAVVIVRRSATTGEPPRVLITGSPITNSPAAVPENWQMYQKADLGITLQHPTEMTVTERPKAFALNMWGPTQRTETELYDGISFIVNEENFPPGVTTLEELAQSYVQDVEQHATITQPLQPYTLNGRAGYIYSFEGIGTFTSIIIPATSTSRLQITYSAPDPDTRGYQTIVEQILSTIQFTSP